MNSFKIQAKLYAITALVLLLIALPFKCFASSGDSSDSSVTDAKLMRNAFIAEAKTHVGSPYVLGATGPDKFDCSGLVVYCAQKSINVNLPRTVKTMYSYVKLIQNDQKEPGDLLFFKTKGDGTISHVGIYIGNNQFISALSDGPNTGVVVNSLKEAYWKPKYVCAGKFLTSSSDGKVVKTKENSDSDEDDSTKTASEGKKETDNEDYGKYSGFSSNKEKFVDNLLVDGTFTVDWSLFTTKRFMPNFRGLTAGGNIYYTKSAVSPGIGFQTKWNFGTKTLQIPIIFSVGFGEFVRGYAGPVITIGDSFQPDTDSRIKASVFPGIIGIQLQTPSLVKGKMKLHIYQDFSYTIFNNMDGAALSALESAASGFVLNTGVRVTFPLSKFF